MNVSTCGAAAGGSARAPGLFGPAPRTRTEMECRAPGARPFGPQRARTGETCRPNQALSRAGNRCGQDGRPPSQARSRPLPFPDTLLTGTMRGSLGGTGHWPAAWRAPAIHLLACVTLGRSSAASCRRIAAPTTLDPNGGGAAHPEQRVVCAHPAPCRASLIPDPRPLLPRQPRAAWCRWHEFPRRTHEFASRWHALPSRSRASRVRCHTPTVRWHPLPRGR